MSNTRLFLSCAVYFVVLFLVVRWLWVRMPDQDI
jgi:hypothetical protein